MSLEIKSDMDNFIENEDYLRQFESILDVPMNGWMKILKDDLAMNAHNWNMREILPECMGAALRAQTYDELKPRVQGVLDIYFKYAHGNDVISQKRRWR